MGVPKFFKYISERYPCLSEVVKEHQVFDGERKRERGKGRKENKSNVNSYTTRPLFSSLLRRLSFLLRAEICLLSNILIAQLFNEKIYNRFFYSFSQ